MRKLIAGMKISLDQKVAGLDGYADWVVRQLTDGRVSLIYGIR